MDTSQEPQVLTLEALTRALYTVLDDRAVDHAPAIFELLGTVARPSRSIAPRLAQALNHVLAFDAPELRNDLEHFTERVKEALRIASTD